MAKGTVVIDPGHGGSLDEGGSSKNNAVSPSGVLEKNMTLGFADREEDVSLPCLGDGRPRASRRLQCHRGALLDDLIANQ